LRGVVHDTWLEETSAMMTEDIVSPAVIPPPAGGYNKILNVRLPAYLASGGGVSYINWPTLSSSEPFYGMGGGFGAFLNRRYGLSIYQGLVTSCVDGRAATATSPAQTSLTCLDQLIRAQGGSGFRDELSRFGATVFGRLWLPWRARWSLHTAGQGFVDRQAGRSGRAGRRFSGHFPLLSA
jgi:hypothetical protein